MFMGRGISWKYLENRLYKIARTHFAGRTSRSGVTSIEPAERADETAGLTSVLGFRNVSVTFDMQ